MYHLQCQNLRNRPESDWQCCYVCVKHKKKDCPKCDTSPKKRLSFTARRRKNLMDSEEEEEEDSLSKRRVKGSSKGIRGEYIFGNGCHFADNTNEAFKR